jgi:hypothetical protein
VSDANRAESYFLGRRPEVFLLGEEYRRSRMSIFLNRFRPVVFYWANPT